MPQYMVIVEVPPVHTFTTAIEKHGTDYLRSYLDSKLPAGSPRRCRSVVPVDDHELDRGGAGGYSYGPTEAVRSERARGARAAIPCTAPTTTTSVPSPRCSHPREARVGSSVMPPFSQQTRAARWMRAG